MIPDFRGIECDETDDIGFTPLMVACQVGRPDNVEVLLAHAKKQAEEKAEEAMGRIAVILLNFEILDIKLLL